jgi:thiol-disulfide isomerase/thioredoxin
VDTSPFASRLWSVAAPIALVLVLAIACLSLFWFLLHSREVAIASHPRMLQLPNLQGQMARDFTLSVSGRPFRLYASTKPVLLEMFATWCPHCRNEVPTMNALYRRYKERVTILAVTGSYGGETPGDIPPFVRRFRVAYPIAFDRSRRVLQEFDTVGFPMYVLVGTDHRIIFQDFGEVPYAELVQPMQSASR